MSKGTVTTEQLDKLLQRLSSDHEFREKLLGDPVGALAEHGVEVDPESVPTVRRLPPMETLADQRNAIKEKLDGKVGLALFLLSA